MKPYDAYLFDWDGTIARTMEVWIEVVREAFEWQGMTDVTDDDIVQTFGNLRTKATELGVTPERIEEFDKMVGDLSHAKVPYAPAYEGALEAIESLKSQGKRLALITTDWRRNVDAKLVHNNLESCFDVVITGDDVKAPKPDPEGILRALEEIGVSKENAVMIGDSPHDLGAARQAGIDSILFYPPSHQLFYRLGSLEHEKPTHIISDLRDIVTREEA